MTGEQRDSETPPEAADAYAAHHDELDLTPGMHTSPARRLFWIALLLVLLLALFNSRGLVSWSAKLPEGPVSNAVIQGAYTWNQWMTRMGAAQVFTAVQRLVCVDIRGKTMLECFPDMAPADSNSLPPDE
jgi:hypothetical protein